MDAEYVEEISSPGESGKEECVWCDRAFAIFGIAMGLVFLYIGVDILMGSKVSIALSGGSDNADG